MTNDVHKHPHFFKRPDQIHEPLHILTMITNPIRYRTRWKLFSDWKLRMEALGGKVYIAEIQFGEREFCVTEPDNIQHLRLHTDTEVWHKENALNLLMKRLPIDWKYMAWIDADVTFARNDIINETLHQLQHYQIVQMWSQAQDLDPNHQVIQSHKSFAYCYTHGIPWQGDPSYPYGKQKTIHFHPGFAWAARREAIDALGGLIDFCVLGSADHHMAHALIGEVERTLMPNLSERYKYLLRRWQNDYAEPIIKRNIGYVPGLLLHEWHGPKAARRYQDRWKILTETSFDPDKDLKPDWQGLWQLTGENIELRDRLRAYFRGRDEDSTHTDQVWSDTMMKGKE